MWDIIASSDDAISEPISRKQAVHVVRVVKGSTVWVRMARCA